MIYKGYELYNKGGIDGDRLLAFLEKFITNKYKNKVIILDNASSHRNIRVKELINKNNRKNHAFIKGYIQQYNFD